MQGWKRKRARGTGLAGGGLAGGLSLSTVVRVSLPLCPLVHHLRDLPGSDTLALAIIKQPSRRLVIARCSRLLRPFAASVSGFGLAGSGLRARVAQRSCLSGNGLASFPMSFLRRH